MTQTYGEMVLAAQIHVAALPEPETEYVFHPVRKWRFDFSWPAYRIAAEVEGGTWANGRHTRGAGFANDCMKYNEAVLDGWRVFRFPTAQVEDGTAIRLIETAFLKWEVRE